MIGNRLYIQICLVLFAGLTVYALAASFAWNAAGLDGLSEDLLSRIPALASLLLPPDTAPVSLQMAAVQDIATVMSFDVTLFDASGALVTSSGVPARFVQATAEVGIWEQGPESSHWMTILPDGRTIVLDLADVELPNETLGVTIAFFSLSGVIAALMFPIVRRITRRLETLQTGVERIGAGNLSARVEIEGNDEIAKLAVSFNRSTETIEDLMNRQRMLLANASHELRTPLSRIRLGIEMLDTSDTPRRRAALREDITELDALIDEVILMTRFDTGVQLETFHHVDLMAIVAEECARVEGCEISGTLAEVIGDARMLQHLARNLIDNALKHGEQPVRVSVTQSAHGVELIVADNGSGIPIEEQTRVFEPFYRAANKQNVPGHGLGLPLVARIAKAHGATVEIKTQSRSAISVCFPNDTITAEQNPLDPRKEKA